ncbi:hypothetical protein KY347_01985 [Candidatus Woesearchaeota archaeon]|nr:hypothetical protein [Candidatus Woesearchaeota archaeon]
MVNSAPLPEVKHETVEQFIEEALSAEKNREPMDNLILNNMLTDGNKNIYEYLKHIADDKLMYWPDYDTPHRRFFVESVGGIYELLRREAPQDGLPKPSMDIIKKVVSDIEHSPTQEDIITSHIRADNNSALLDYLLIAKETLPSWYKPEIIKSSFVIYESLRRQALSVKP